MFLLNLIYDLNQHVFLEKADEKNVEERFTRIKFAPYFVREGIGNLKIGLIVAEILIAEIFMP